MMSRMTPHRCHFPNPVATPKETIAIRMAERRDWRGRWPQVVLAFSAVIIAVVLVRLDLRQQRNNRIRTLCAEYWGAPDGGDQEQQAWEKTKQLVGVSSLDMLSFCRFYGDQ